MRILFVAPYVPSPIRVRPFQWIRVLSRLGQRIRLVVLQPPEDGWLEDDVPVSGYCESVSVFPLSRARTVVNGLAALPRDVPLQAAYSRHPAAEARITAEVQQCDVVHIEHLRGSLLTRRVRGIPQVIDAVDSISALFEETQIQARSWQHRLMARIDLSRTRRFEAALPRRFDRTLVSSAHDAARFRELAGARVDERLVVLPNGVDLEYFCPREGVRHPATILFTGKMSYHANEAAALRLVERVIPLVWQKRPDVRVVIAGKDPSPGVRLLAHDPRVSVTGFVEDLRACFWSATLVMAPLVYGTGIQNKVLEAMACGVPVIASAKACEGIAAANGRDLLVGRDDQELAALALTLLDNADLRRRLAADGRRYVATHHDWSQLGRRLIGVYEDARAAHRRCA